MELVSALIDLGTWNLIGLNWYSSDWSAAWCTGWRSCYALRNRAAFF